MIQTLAEWLTNKLDVPVYIYEIPEHSSALTVIQLERSGGGPARGSTKTDTADLWFYGPTLADAELLYKRAEALLKNSTRMPGIISVTRATGPVFNIDAERRLPHAWATWSVLQPYRRLAGARG